MIRKVKLAKLVLDYSLYPRESVSSVQVTDMLDALAAGVVFPPIIADKKSLRIIDGFHRYTSHKRAFKDDPNASIQADLRTYKDDKEMFLDAVRCNAGHGRRFAPNDKTKIIVAADTLGISPKYIADALHITVAKLGNIRTQKTGTVQTPQGRLEVALKGTVGHLRGKKLTPFQAQAMPKLGGQSPIFYCNQLVILMETDMIDRANDAVMHTLCKLQEMIGAFMLIKAKRKTG